MCFFVLKGKTVPRGNTFQGKHSTNNHGVKSASFRVIPYSVSGQCRFMMLTYAGKKDIKNEADLFSNIHYLSLKSRLMPRRCLAAVNHEP